MSRSRILHLLPPLLVGTILHAGKLEDSYYPNHLVPEVIRKATAERESNYVARLKERASARLRLIREVASDQSKAQNPTSRQLALYLDSLLQSLFDATSFQNDFTPPPTVSSKSWYWRHAWQTKPVLISGNEEPRTTRRGLGILQRIELKSPAGGVTSVLLVKAKSLEPPAKPVICLPDIDPYTRMTEDAVSTISNPTVRALSDAGFLVVAAELEAFGNLGESSVKRGLLTGEPLLGQAASEVSRLVSYLGSQKEFSGSQISIYGRGWSGFVAALAAAMDERIKAVVVENGIPGFRSIIENGEELEGEWLIPGLLQFVDGPDLAALISPRPMLIRVSSSDRSSWSAAAAEARQLSEALYSFYGAPDNFEVSDLSVEGPSDPAKEAQLPAQFLRSHFSKVAEPTESNRVPVRSSRPTVSKKAPYSITDVQNFAEWEGTRNKILRRVEKLLGGFPDRGDDHTGTIVEEGQEAGFRWERVLVKTTPETIMPVLITRNGNVPPRAPALIHLSGYSISYEQDALTLAKEMADQGFVGVFACPKTATGFRQGGTPRDAVGILEGRPSLGEWAWNLMGLVDFLQTRQDIDSERLGITGWSMGTTMLTYLMPFETRIKAGAGFVAFNQMKGLLKAFRDESVPAAEGTSFLEGHPLYNFVPGLLQTCDVDDFLATVAPRPLLSLAGEQDEYFPYRIVQNIYDRQSHVYRLAGVPDRLELLIYPGGHGLAEPLRQKAWSFFSKWLKEPGQSYHWIESSRGP